MLVNDLPIASLTDLPTPTMLGALECLQRGVGRAAEPSLGLRHHRLLDEAVIVCRPPRVSSADPLSRGPWSSRGSAGRGRRGERPRAGGRQLEGTITDSWARLAPVAGVQVSATRVGSHRETTFVALTDEGRFVFERLDAGEYAVGFAHGLSTRSSSADRRDASPCPAPASRARLAVPSGRTLRTLACAGMRLAKGAARWSASSPTPTRSAPGRCAGGRHVDRLTFDKGIVQAMVLERSGGAVTDSLDSIGCAACRPTGGSSCRSSTPSASARGPDHDRGRLGRERAQPLVQP